MKKKALKKRIRELEAEVLKLKIEKQLLQGSKTSYILTTSPPETAKWPLSEQPYYVGDVPPDLWPFKVTC